MESKVKEKKKELILCKKLLIEAKIKALVS